MTVAKRRILFFGDSITAGEGDEDAFGWPGRLIAAENRRLAPDGIRPQGYPLGVGGNRFDHLADRWFAEAHRRLATRLGAIVIMIGVSDAVRDASTVDHVPLDLEGKAPGSPSERPGIPIVSDCPARNAMFLTARVNTCASFRDHYKKYSSQFRPELIC